MTAGPILTTVLDHDPYTEVPCAFLICENDLALPFAYQEMMAAMQAKREETSLTVYRCNAGHSPHLTWTDGLVERIHDWTGSIV
jgi:hypothetical protein